MLETPDLLEWKVDIEVRSRGDDIKDGTEAARGVALCVQL